MGKLEGTSYAALIAGCTKCDRKAFEVTSFVEREQPVMIGEPSQDGRWIHDDAKFIDGTFKIRCLQCGDEPHASDDCPRCDSAGALAAALSSPARLAVPKMCPQCKT